MKMLRLTILAIATLLLSVPLTSGVASAQAVLEPPTITVQPHSTETGYYGPSQPGYQLYWSEATADGPLVGQWQVSTDAEATWSDIPGETFPGSDEVYAEYDGPVTPDNHRYRYRIEWTNAGGTTTSNVVGAALHYVIVTEDPQDTTVAEGDTARFAVTADSGTGYGTKWQVSDDGGQTFTDLGPFGPNSIEITEADRSLDGNLYRAVVEDAGITATSAAARLTVEPLPPRVPSAPTEMTATQSGPSQVTVAWQAPADEGSEPVAGYSVTFDDETTTYPADAREAVFDLVLPGAYDATVLATNAVGDSVAAQASVQVTLPPGDDTDDGEPDEGGDGDGNEDDGDADGGADDDDADEDGADDDGHERTADDDGDVANDSDDRDGDAAVDDNAAERVDAEGPAPAQLPATGGGADLLLMGVTCIAVGMRLRRQLS